MILLFMSVWAIVIALNEVLFAAQPFTLTSVAAAMPSTLIFSVILSAAVYLAKRKIIDAVEKGRPIDKKFVAELTPQVGHELNSMRRKIEAMDKKQGKGRMRPNGRKSRNFPSESELAESNKQMLKSNRETYERLYKNAEADVRKQQLKDEKARAKANAKAQKLASKEAKAAQKQAEKEARAKAALHDGADAVRNKGWFGSVKSESVGDPNDFLKEAHAQMLEQQQNRTEEALRRHKEQTQSASAQSHPDIKDLKEKIARDKEMQKERREAQIAALGEVSKEEQAISASQAKEQAEKAAKEAARKREQQEAAMRKLSEENAKARAAAEQKTIALKKAREEAIARAKARSESIAKAAMQRQAEEQAKQAVQAKQAAQARAQAQKAAQDAQASRNISSQVQREHASDDLANIYQSEASVRQPKQKVVTPVQFGGGSANTQGNGMPEQASSSNEGLAYLMNEAKNASADSVSMVNAARARQDNVQQGNNHRVDTSALRGPNSPKVGAGLDTSALKKATLPSSRRAAESDFSGKFLKSSGTRSDAPMQGRPMQMSSSRPTAAQAGAAMRATLQNDTSLQRGKVNTQEFTNYQANARDRALARAQAPKSQAPMPSSPNRAASAPRADSPAVNKASAQLAAGAKRSGPIGIGTAMAPSMDSSLGSGVQNIGSDAAVARRVVSTSNTVQTGPAQDNMPKVAPSDPLGGIQTAPKMRSSSNVSAQQRDNLFKQEVKFVDDGIDAGGANLTGTDRIHAQANAATYQQMQKSAPHAEVSAEHASKRKRVRPSDKLRADESV